MMSIRTSPVDGKEHSCVVHNMPRSSSSSLCSGVMPTAIHLDNLEWCQDHWAWLCESTRNHLPPPTLNTPRSLKVCAMCQVRDPYRLLEKLSLKQWLHQTMRCNDLDTAVAALTAEVETKPAMKEAVLAFQRAGIGMGTQREKLVAHRSFLNQESARAPLLAALRAERQKIILERDGSIIHRASGVCSPHRVAAPSRLSRQVNQETDTASQRDEDRSLSCIPGDSSVPYADALANPTCNGKDSKFSQAWMPQPRSPPRPAVTVNHHTSYEVNHTASLYQQPDRPGIVAIDSRELHGTPQPNSDPASGERQSSPVHHRQRLQPSTNTFTHTVPRGFHASGAGRSATGVESPRTLRDAIAGKLPAAAAAPSQRSSEAGHSGGRNSSPLPVPPRSGARRHSYQSSPQSRASNDNSTAVVSIDACDGLSASATVFPYAPAYLSVAPLLPLQCATDVYYYCVNPTPMAQAVRL